MQTNIKLVLKYLKDKDCIESFLTLERQSGVSLINYSKEIEFFKKIMLKGDFNQAVTFLQAFQNRLQEGRFKKIMMDLYRQKLCELIENPNEEELKNIFEKELINYCNEEQFQDFFNFLTYRSVNEIQQFQKWTVLRGRYECFANTIPYLDMFNSVLKNEQLSEDLENILELYHANKESLKGPITFNKKNQIDYFDNASKNKSDVSQSYHKIHERQISDESQKKQPIKLSESNHRQKQLIKNSVVNMNISGNYSQMKSKLNANNSMNSKHSFNSIEQNESRYHLSQLYQDNKSKVVHQQKELIEKNASNMEKCIKDKEKQSFVQEKRPRVNASLNGPMNRQKLDNSVKVDNFMKNQSQSHEQNTPNSYKNIKLQKSQMMNNSSNYSNKIPNKSEKFNYSNRKQNPSLNPMTFNLYNDMESSQLNEIQEEDHSQATKSVKNERAKYSYLMSKRQDDELEEEVRKNIEYLEQTSSVIYNKEDLESDNYGFSPNKGSQKQLFRVKNITKLAATSDYKAIRTCQFSSSGNYFAVGTNSSILKIFDVQELFNKNKYQQIYPAYQIEGLHLKSIFCLNWSNNQRSLATCSNDLNIKLTQIGANFKDHKTSVIGKHDSCIRMVKFSPLEHKIVSCGDDSLLKVWDTGKLNRCVNLKGHINSVSAFKMQNDNELYSVSKDQTIRKWDLRINENVTTSKLQESQITYIANNIEGIVVSHKNGNVSFFSHDLELIHAVQIHQEQIRSIEALKGQNTLLTASFDGHVALFNQESSHEPSYYQHNESGDDKVVFATFLHSQHHHGFASTSTQGLCHVYSYE